MSSASSLSSSDDGAFDNVLDIYLQKRKEELREEFTRQRLVLEQGHGELVEIEEAVFLENLQRSNHALCHFYHPDFKTCEQLDVVLQELAKTHLETRFIRLNALSAGFFVNKLKIKTLPTLCAFENGRLLRKFIGFQDIGDTYPDIRLLRQELVKLGVIQNVGKQPINKKGTILGYSNEDSDSF